MAWGKLTSKTLTGASATITTDVITTPKKFNIILDNRLDASSSNNNHWRFGSGSVDTGSNYAYRNSTNGGADGTGTSSTDIQGHIGGGAEPNFGITYFINITTEEKLFINFLIRQNTAGAGTAPQRSEMVGKWVNTSNQANIFQGKSDDGIKTYAVDSNLTVIGTD